MQDYWRTSYRKQYYQYESKEISNTIHHYIQRIINRIQQCTLMNGFWWYICGCTMMNKVDNCQVQLHSLIQEQFSQIHYIQIMEHITHRHIERHRQLSWILILDKLAKFRHKHIKRQDMLIISSFIGLSCYLSLHRITYPTHSINYWRTTW